MKRNGVKLLLAAIALVSVAAGGGYWLAMHRVQGQASSSMSAPAGAQGATAPASQRTSAEKIDPKSGRKVLYWHDPMVPATKFDQPGKSPFMDMQLVPVYADEAGDQGKISISSRTEQNLGIRTATVTQGNIAAGFSTVGAVSIDERGINAVQSRVNGYVEKLHVRAQYDVVTRGQRLVDIYAPDWLAAEEEFLALRRITQPGVDMLAEAARERLKLLGISEDQIQAIERDGKANARVTLYAPQSGVVWELGTREGMAVNPGMTLFKLASLATVWVNADVPEAQAGLVKPGVPVQAQVAAVPGTTFNGRVAALLPDVNVTTRTIKARIVLGNPGGALKPGMFATLTFSGAEKPSLMVPSEAVIATGTRTVVIVSSDGRFQPVDVQIGREGGGMTEIRSGLTAGQQIVLSGQFLIDSEASLRGTEARLGDMAPAREPTAVAPAHRGRGTVEMIGKTEVTLSHGPIPSLDWGPMTMEFKLPPTGVPKDIAVGDTVEFEIRPLPGGAYEITHIARAVTAANPSDKRGMKGTDK
ncbi:MAG: efflux RND transporter periplasmic adaptor subunit [Betaproteobacteria bacterium]